MGHAPLPRRQYAALGRPPGVRPSTWRGGDRAAGRALRRREGRPARTLRTGPRARVPPSACQPRNVSPTKQAPGSPAPTCGGRAPYRILLSSAPTGPLPLTHLNRAHRPAPTSTHPPQTPNRAHRSARPPPPLIHLNRSTVRAARLHPSARKVLRATKGKGREGRGEGGGKARRLGVASREVQDDGHRWKARRKRQEPT